MNTAPGDHREPHAPSSSHRRQRFSGAGWSASVLVVMLSAAGAPWKAHAESDCVGPVEARVDFRPGTVLIDESKYSRELKKTAKSGTVHQLGVTHATPLRAIRVQLIERDGCVRPVVSLQLTVRPLVIELARELNGSECLRTYVLSHEMQHVAIYNLTGGRAASQLEREMRGKLSVSRVRSDADKVRDVQAQINERWLPRLDVLMARGDADQEALDIDQERAAQRACSTEIAQFMKTVLR